MLRITAWRRPGTVLRQLMQQDFPGRLAFSLALGMTIGLAPLFWGTTLICGVLAWRLNLNQLAVQMANFACYPLQILLLALSPLQPESDKDHIPGEP
jgi:uncharacterized protein (DUF2062 family)